MMDLTVKLPELIPKEIRNEALKQETKRITPLRHNTLLDEKGLIDLIQSKTGPRLVIMNTVQSAAVLAESMRKSGHDVLHLSTALAPVHRELILELIKQRLHFGVRMDIGINKLRGSRC